MVKRFLHWLAHLTGRNEGHVITWNEDGYFYVGFQCDGCGKIDENTIDKVLESELLK